MPTRKSNLVAIIQPFVPSYRVALFDAIDERLRENGLNLEVWHAQPKGRVLARGNAASGRWSVPIKQYRFSVGRRNVTFRNVHRQARRARVVIAGLASTNLETYALAADVRVNLMLWGHGKNFTAKNSRIDGAVEDWLRNRSTHVFVYTQKGKDHLLERGARSSEVTVVQNSTDTQRLKQLVASLPPGTEAKMRHDLDLEGSEVALFIGAFDEPKKLPLLFEATDQIALQRPNFVLLIAGGGPDEAYVHSMAQDREHVRLIGRADGVELARLSTVVDLISIPGRIGLVAVDALALGLPVVTTLYPYHAPEAEYLTAGRDSVWTEMTAEKYAEGISGLLDDRERLARFSSAALKASSAFSVEDSADRFVSAILGAVDAQRV